MTAKESHQEIEGLADPIFCLDDGGRISYWNPACEAAFGVTSAPAIGRTLPGPLEELDPGLLLLLRQNPRTAKAKLLPGVRIGRGVWDVRVAATGSREALAVRCLPSSNEIAGWPRVLADSADAIWAMDHEDRIMAWNRGAVEMFGYTPEEIIGESLERLVPEDLIAAREPERLRRALNELGAVRDYETRRLSRDGRALRVSLTRTQLRDGAGDWTGSSSIVRSLVQRRQIERQMIESEKLATLGQLAASIAQEIGAPLTSIGMAVGRLRGAACEECGALDSLDTIAGQVHRIGRLTRHLVEMAKPSATRLATCDLAGLVRDAVELMDPILSPAGIRIDLRVEGDPPEAPADRGQLQQALLNLLMNARHALELQGGGRIQVEVREARGVPREGRPLRSVLEVVVSDDGLGIDPADLPFVFEPFFSRSGGTGMGLTLARQIAHAHGGAIEAASAPGEGATFTLQIPTDSDE